MSHGRPWRSAGPEVIGWLEWGEQLRDVGRVVLAQPRAVPYYFPRLPGARRRTPPPLRPVPDRTGWVAAMERAVGEQGIGMTEVWRRHSERTWQFAAALAAQEDAGLDDDLLYVAALMHDSGLFLRPDKGESFAAAGARFARKTAIAAGVDTTTADLLEAAIASHISMNPGNELGKYIQFGSLLDVTGHGIWQLDRGLVDQVYARTTRRGFPSDVRKLWLAECERLPLGRAAYARFPGCLLGAARWAPLPHRRT